MGFEEHQIKDARAEAESRFTKEEADAARPLMNAFEFHMLDIFARSVASSLKYFKGRQVKIDRSMSDLDYDLGPDGKER
jgi:hypothetical protein